MYICTYVILFFLFLSFFFFFLGGGGVGGWKINHKRLGTEQSLNESGILGYTNL